VCTSSCAAGGATYDTICFCLCRCLCVSECTCMYVHNKSKVCKQQVLCEWLYQIRSSSAVYTSFKTTFLPDIATKPAHPETAFLAALNTVGYTVDGTHTKRCVVNITRFCARPVLILDSVVVIQRVHQYSTSVILTTHMLFNLEPG
jgi:hypothetical protein